MFFDRWLVLVAILYTVAIQWLIKIYEFLTFTSIKSFKFAIEQRINISKDFPRDTIAFCFLLCKSAKTGQENEFQSHLKEFFFYENTGILVIDFHVVWYKHMHELEMEFYTSDISDENNLQLMTRVYMIFCD